MVLSIFSKAKLSAETVGVVEDAHSYKVRLSCLHIGGNYLCAEFLF